MATADVQVRIRADTNQARQAMRALGSDMAALQRQARATGGVRGGGAHALAGGALLGRATRGVGGGLGRMAGAIGMGGFAGGPFLALGAAAGYAIHQTFAWQDAWVEVIKTVGKEAESAGLKEKIFGLSKATGIGPQEVARVMAMGGTMNVPIAELESYTDAVLKAGIATNMTTEAAAEMGGQFASAMRETDPDKWRKIFSTVAAMGDMTPGKESTIMEMATRLALAGSSVGLKSHEVLGLSAFTAGVGIDPEMGGSALSRLMMAQAQAAEAARGGVVPDAVALRNAEVRFGDLGDDLTLAQMRHGDLFSKRGKRKRGVSEADVLASEIAQKRLRREQEEARKAMEEARNPGLGQAKVFAGLAGMGVAEFGTAFKADPMGTFDKVLGGLQKADAEGRLFSTLENMGTEGVRDIMTLLPMVRNREQLGGILDRARTEWEDPKKLQAEFEARMGAEVNQARQMQAEAAIAAIAMGEPAIKEFFGSVQAHKATLDAYNAGQITGIDALGRFVGNLDMGSKALLGFAAMSMVGGVLGLGGKLIGAGAGALAGGGAAGAAGAGAAGAAAGAGAAGLLVNPFTVGLGAFLGLEGAKDHIAGVGDMTAGFNEWIAERWKGIPILEDWARGAAERGRQQSANATVNVGQIVTGTQA
jgi:hypothetical protein